MDNANVNLIRGHMDTIILRTLQSQDKYGLEILNEIKDLSKNLYSLKQPTLYNSLKRLEKQGLITSYPGDISNGANRTYYSLTDEGKNFLESDQKEWEFSRSIIDKLLSDKEFDINDETPFNTSDFRPLTKRTNTNVGSIEVEKIVEIEKVVYKYLHPITNEELTKEEYDIAINSIKESYDNVSNPIIKTDVSGNSRDNDASINKNSTSSTDNKVVNQSSEISKKTYIAEKLPPNDKFFDVSEYDFLLDNNQEDIDKSDDFNQIVDNKDFALDSKNNNTESDAGVFYNSIYEEPDFNDTTKSERTVDEFFTPTSQNNTVKSESETVDSKADLFNYDTNIDYNRIKETNYYSDNEKIQSNDDFFNSIYSKEQQESPLYEDYNSPTMDEIKSNFDFKKLNDELSNENIKLKTYEKNNTIDYYTNKYCYINKLFRDFSIIIFLIFNAFLYTMFFALGKEGAIGLSGTLIASGVSLLLPLLALVLYKINPTKRIRNIPTLTSAFLSALILVIMFTIVTVIIGFFIINIDITMPNEYIPAIIMPIASILIVPIGVAIYSLLYNSKLYRVG